MKKLILIALLAWSGHSFAQKHEYTTHISKQFNVQKGASAGVLSVYNVFGDVKIEGYSGSQVTMDIDETIVADNGAELDRAKKEFKLGFDQRADSIYAYTAAPYDSRPYVYHPHDSEHNERKYIVKLAYTIKVPYDINVIASTVNDGEIDVKDVYGKLKVNNVNGGISIKNAKGVTDAYTVNGPVTAYYLAVPSAASSYYTVNGKVEVTFPAGLSGDMQFKSLNGEFYTDFTDIEALPTEVVKTIAKKSNTTTYKLNKNTAVRIGKGGKLFKFETLNGDVYIKKA
ncbi:hypothetical protein [Mucilaginibacter sp. dw_454]|uniref:hypothetical protein n=1 Tax=Mucilaginibacter sp. dw_454 TaxID=2720079 RepID=UPI001BD52A40|nr:hypothetical protein [Mucilaginibacter sp. dw_454]